MLKRRFESADGREVRWQIVWPTKFRQQFMELAHGGMTGGHLGRRRTAATIQSRAYWPSWSSDLECFLRACQPCAQYHRGALPRHAKMQTFLSGEPWERVSIDLTGPHPKSSRGNVYILTLVDHFSKWAEAIPLSTHTAPVIARALVINVFSRFGAPRQLLSDLAPELQGELFSELLRWYGIDRLRTTPYKPSTNSSVERFHRTMNSMLGKVVSVTQRDWDERLPQVMAAYRATRHESTGYSPNQLFLGREVVTPLDLLMDRHPEEQTVTRPTDDYIAQMKEQAGFAYSLARQHLQKAAERRKIAYNIKVKEMEFRRGNWIYYYYPWKY